MSWCRSCFSNNYHVPFISWLPYNEFKHCISQLVWIHKTTFWGLIPAFVQSLSVGIQVIGSLCRSVGMAVGQPKGKKLYFYNCVLQLDVTTCNLWIKSAHEGWNLSPDMKSRCRSLSLLSRISLLEYCGQSVLLVEESKMKTRNNINGLECNANTFFFLICMYFKTLLTKL